MKLTYYEDVNLMKRSCSIHGCTTAELKRLLNSVKVGESAKADAIAKTYVQLKSMQMAKKTEVRSDRESRGLLKALSSKLTPYEEFIAQSKNPKEMKESLWVKRIFNRGKATQVEAIALLSNSSLSCMKALDPFLVERHYLSSDSITTRSAGAFCKRFKLI